MRLYKQNMRGTFFSCVRSILICIKFRFYVIFYFIKDSIERKVKLIGNFQDMKIDIV